MSDLVKYNMDEGKTVLLSVITISRHIAQSLHVEGNSLIFVDDCNTVLCPRYTENAFVS